MKGEKYRITNKMVKGLFFGLGMLSLVTILSVVFSGIKGIYPSILILLNSLFMVLNFWMAFSDNK